jgi:uncharacterized protein (DUF2235 family)
MPKNIALFSDGTGNSSAKLFRTNVWRLYEALDRSAPDQIAYYDDGVGTSSFKPYAILGGALGVGLKRNVQHIYAFLCRNYEPGDRIHAFGFSRGAFTIRVFIGLVHDQGLVRAATERELWQGVEERWRAHRKKARARISHGIRAHAARRATAPTAADPGVKFTFVGLWDTVSAYGMPIDELTRAWDQYVWPLSMNDRVPSASIAKAFHALSLDDERNTFHPLLWTETGADAGANAKSVHLDDERISQVWFTGVHSNVGGGYPDDALSYVPLHWIMSEAAKHLRFRPGELEKVRAAASPFGRIYDSRKGLGGYYRYNPRKIARLVADDYHHVSIERPKSTRASSSACGEAMTAMRPSSCRSAMPSSPPTDRSPTRPRLVRRKVCPRARASRGLAPRRRKACGTWCGPDASSTSRRWRARRFSRCFRSFSKPGSTACASAPIFAR